MATVDELLKKQKHRLEKMSASLPSSAPIERKKITRVGPSRPWQENLPQYQQIPQPIKAITPLPLKIEPENKPLEALENHADSVSKPLALREHSVSIASPKPLALREHSVSNGFLENASKDDSVSIAYAEALADPLAMREQFVSKPLAETGFDALVGKEKKLLSFIFKKCHSIGSLESHLITTEELRLLLEVSSERLRNLIYRLSQKGVLQVIEIKNGRAGWRKFRLRSELFQKLYLNDSVSKPLAQREHSVSIAYAKALAEPLASASSSSSSSYLFKDLNTTTTGSLSLSTNAPAHLDPEWLVIDLSPLSKIGFTQSHLIQIIQQGKLKPNEVQDSIHFFAFDLKRNGKGSGLNGSPLNFFMGIVRKGIPYAPPENYESPTDEARRKILEFKERKENERQTEEAQIIELEFLKWKRGLSNEQIFAIVPEFARRPGQIQDSSLKTYFTKSIWPEHAAKILGLKSEQVNIGRQIEQPLTGEGV